MSIELGKRIALLENTADEVAYVRGHIHALEGVIADCEQQIAALQDQEARAKAKLQNARLHLDMPKCAM